MTSSLHPVCVLHTTPPQGAPCPLCKGLGFVESEGQVRINNEAVQTKVKQRCPQCRGAKTGSYGTK